MENVQQSPSFEPQQNMSQTTEHSETITLRSEKRTKQVRSVSKKDIDDLNDRVKNELTRNKRAYQKALSLNPYFSMKLQCPTNHFKGQDYHTGSIQAMIRQLELLLDDGRYIQKSIVKFQLINMQNEHRQTYGNEWRHHYAYLRKIWLNINDSESDKALDMVDQLNKKVVLVKNNLFSTISLEKQSYSKVITDPYSNVERKISQIVQNVDDYEKLRESSERSKMAYEDIYQLLADKVEQVKKRVGQRNEVIRQIKSDNEELRRVNKDLKQKLLSCQRKQAQLLSQLKENNLEFRPRQLQKDVERLQSPLQSQSRSRSELMNFDGIKFQKMVRRDMIRSAEELQPQLTEDVRSEKKKEKECSLRNSPEAKRQSEQNINSNNDRSDRRIDISDTKSIDGKRNRFVRMRSPVGGKLVKNKGQQGEDTAPEIGSPGLKAYKEKARPS